MLGLPVITGDVGFYPSCLLLIFNWLVMLCTGLLVLEVNLILGDRVSIMTMAEKTLGSAGRYLSGLLFVFLFYSLLVAYISGSGELFSEMLQDLFGMTLDATWGSAVFGLLFGLLIYLGVGMVDGVNRILMGGLLLSYVLLLVAGWRHVEPSYLMRRDWSASMSVLPAMLVSFGFHNLIPSLTGYLHSDRLSLRRVIIVGSSLPLVLYILWECLVLGLVPWGEAQHASIDGGKLATQILRQSVGGSWIVDVAEAFAFFAIVTSFLGVALSLVDFLADGLSVKRNRRTRIFLTLAVILPPFFFAFTYPGAFLLALKYAGSLGAAVLFGVLPTIMVWRSRYVLKLEGPRMLPGGRPALLLVMAAACVVVTAVLF